MNDGASHLLSIASNTKRHHPPGLCCSVSFVKRTNNNNNKNRRRHCIRLNRCVNLTCADNIAVTNSSRGTGHWISTVAGGRRPTSVTKLSFWQDAAASRKTICCRSNLVLFSRWKRVTGHTLSVCKVVPLPNLQPVPEVYDSIIRSSEQSVFFHSVSIPRYWNFPASVSKLNKHWDEFPLQYESWCHKFVGKYNSLHKSSS